MNVFEAFIRAILERPELVVEVTVVDSHSSQITKLDQLISNKTHLFFCWSKVFKVWLDFLLVPVEQMLQIIYSPSRSFLNLLLVLVTCQVFFIPLSRDQLWIERFFIH